MDLRSSKVIGMAWNLRSACRNRWSALRNALRPLPRYRDSRLGHPRRNTWSTDHLSGMAAQPPNRSPYR